MHKTRNQKKTFYCTLHFTLLRGIVQEFQRRFRKKAAFFLKRAASPNTTYDYAWGAFKDIQIFCKYS